LIKENERVQKPVYYVNKSLVGTELNYLPIKKLVFALITASRRLCHYFVAHLIKVLISSPMKSSLHLSDLSGQMKKWFVELGQFHIEYEPKTTIKGQLLADFIAEFTDNSTRTTRGQQETILHQLASHLLQLGRNRVRVQWT